MKKDNQLKYILAYVVIDTMSRRDGFDDWWNNIDENSQDEILAEIEAVFDGQQLGFDYL